MCRVARPKPSVKGTKNHNSNTQKKSVYVVQVPASSSSMIDIDAGFSSLIYLDDAAKQIN